MASIATPGFEALPSSESIAGKRLAAAAAAAAHPRAAPAIAVVRRSRQSSSSTTTPTATAASDPRENVRYSASPGAGTSAAAALRIPARRVGSAAMRSSSTTAIAMSSPSAFQ
jgi:hypothetical protein